MQQVVSMILELLKSLATPQVKAALAGLFGALIAAKFPGIDPATQDAIGGLILTFTAGLLIPSPGQSATSVMQHPDVQEAIKAAVKAALAEHAQAGAGAAKPAAPAAIAAGAVS